MCPNLLCLTMLRLSVVKNSKICVSSGGRPSHHHTLLPPGFFSEESEQELEGSIEDFSTRVTEHVGWGSALARPRLQYCRAWEHTLHSLCFIFLGRELKCPLAVCWDLCPGSDIDNVSGKNQFWTHACSNLLAARKRVAPKFKKGWKLHRYKEGDLVRYQLRLRSSKGQNISAKLLLRWSAPVTTAKIVRPNVVAGKPGYWRYHQKGPHKPVEALLYLIHHCVLCTLWCFFFSWFVSPHIFTTHGAWESLHSNLSL